MLTAVCFKYNGYRANRYRPDYVNAIGKMLKRHLHIPHKLICITDDPKDIKCETYPMWPFPKVRGIPEGRYDNYRCLKIFDIAEQIGDKILVLDLDILINGNITRLITDDDFKIIKGEYAPYNSSMYLFKAGTNKHVYESLDPDTVEEALAEERIKTGNPLIGTDQAWLSVKIPSAPTWDKPDSVYRVTAVNGGMPRFVYFAGNVKPWDVLAGRKYPRLHTAYMQYLT